MILGEWNGNYRYLHNNGKYKVGKFTMDIFEFKNNDFLGIIIDDTEYKGSSIKGYLIDKQVSFIKTYHSIEVKLENGQTIKSNKAHTIKYEGEIVSETEIYGTWFRQEQKITHNGTEYLIKPEQGSWSAKKN